LVPVTLLHMTAVLFWGFPVCNSWSLVLLTPEMSIPGMPKWQCFGHLPLCNFGFPNTEMTGPFFCLTPELPKPGMPKCSQQHFSPECLSRTSHFQTSRLPLHHLFTVLWYSRYLNPLKYSSFWDFPQNPGLLPRVLPKMDGPHRFTISQLMTPCNTISSVNLNPR
jgi:hypothetical protein